MRPSRKSNSISKRDQPPSKRHISVSTSSHDSVFKPTLSAWYCFSCPRHAPSVYMDSSEVNFLELSFLTTKRTTCRELVCIVSR